MSYAAHEDRDHYPLCDWNLYWEDRADADLCNLPCEDVPDAVRDAWARWDAGETPRWLRLQNEPPEDTG